MRQKDKAGQDGNLEERDFSVRVGKAVQCRHGFQVGDQSSGQAAFVQDQRMEPVELYKASGLQVLKRPVEHIEAPPPCQGQPPDLETRPTGSGSIAGWTRRPTTPSVCPASGAAWCRWR